jgi:hypothetical protein
MVIFAFKKIFKNDISCYILKAFQMLLPGTVHKVYTVAVVPGVKC